MRTITLREYLLEEINRMLEEEGRDCRVVYEREKPQLKTVENLDEHRPRT
jgi:hypothetical protein